MRTDGQTDLQKLTVALLNFATASTMFGGYITNNTYFFTYLPLMIYLYIISNNTLSSAVPILRLYNSFEITLKKSVLFVQTLKRILPNKLLFVSLIINSK